MMRAPGWGMGEMPLMEEGTASSQLWSCLERVGPSSVYQEPAWLASRVVIVMGGVELEALSWWHDRYMQVDEIADYKAVQVISNPMWLDGSAELTTTTRTLQWMSTRSQAQ